MSRLARRIAELRRFARAREGATAVEFAIVAIPMLMLIFGIIELGLVLLVSTTLDTAMDFATRDIRTGVFQTTTTGENEVFRKKICDNMTWLAGACIGSGMRVEAETFDEFADANNAPIADPGTYDEDDPPRCWAVGNAGSIVLVRVYYPWKVFTPLLGNVLANGADGRRVFTTATVFRNEPYTPDDTAPADC